MAPQLGSGALGRGAQRVRTSLALVLTAGVLGTQLVSAAGADPNGAPSSTALPTVAGQAVVGTLLTASSGTWDGDAPISYAYQWRRCDQAGTECSDISTATAETYRLKAADLGATLRVVVTATNASGSADAPSAATSTVEAGRPYASAIFGTTDLAHYWRLGESSGHDLVGHGRGRRCDRYEREPRRRRGSR